MKVKARFHVVMSGWVTVEREAESFDVARMDDLDAPENDLLDSMADEAVSVASEQLDGEVDEQKVEVTP